VAPRLGHAALDWLVHTIGLSTRKDPCRFTISTSSDTLYLISGSDKNHHRVEEATKHFALIADAYEVLSDPQERAWYDSHRDAILRGGKEESYGFTPVVYESAI
jgi:hypothetical protein